jgi:ACS family phthalate transporter-like MFS transporter
MLADSNVAGTVGRDTGTASQQAVYQRLTFRIMPFLLICYLANYIDRSNVAMAKLQFMQELGFSEAAYGLGAGLFYAGYICFEVPSNLLLARIGARATISRIMVLWGLVTVGTMFIKTPLGFYVARILLGASEAGFIPGVLLYITYWFPAAYRARMTGIFFLAVPIGAIFGNPLAGYIIHTATGAYGLMGWQWLFLLEGIPAILLGAIAYFWLDNSPADAKWLSASEREQIMNDLQAERKEKGDSHRGSLSRIIRDPKTYIIGFLLFASFTMGNLLSFWIPSIIQRSGVKSVLVIGLLGAVPSIVGMVSLIVSSWHSDRTRERRWHVAVPLIVASFGLVVLTYTTSNPAFALCALVVIIASHYATLPVIFTIPSDYASSRDAAGGIALMSCLGATGGAFGPALLGFVAKATGSLNTGLLVAAAIVMAGAFALIIGIKHSDLARNSTTD